MYVLHAHIYTYNHTSINKHTHCTYVCTYGVFPPYWIRVEECILPIQWYMTFGQQCCKTMFLSINFKIKV